MSFLFQAIIGFILQYLMKAGKYIIAGQFNWKLWKQENAAYAMFGMLILLVLCSLLFFGVEVLTNSLAFIGITLGNDNASGVVLGVLIADYSKDLLKPKRSSE